MIWSTQPGMQCINRIPKQVLGWVTSCKYVSSLDLTCSLFGGRYGVHLIVNGQPELKLRKCLPSCQKLFRNIGIFWHHHNVLIFEWHEFNIFDGLTVNRTNIVVSFLIPYEILENECKNEPICKIVEPRETNLWPYESFENGFGCQGAEKKCT